MSLRHDPRPFTSYLVTFAAGEGKKATIALKPKNKRINNVCAAIVPSFMRLGAT